MTMKVSGKPGKGDVTDRSTSTVVPLTAENLKRIQKPKLKKEGTMQSDNSSPGGMGDKSQKDSKGENPLHVAPQNWQVAVRKLLRSGLGEKEQRQHRVKSRIDQLRKEFEEKP